MDGGNLTNDQIVNLARAIATTDLEAIALEYFSIDKATITNLRFSHRDAETFNRSILENWMHRNGGRDQVQACLLFFIFCKSPFLLYLIIFPL